MIPEMIGEAANEGGWSIGTIQQKPRLLWISFGRGDLTVYVWRDRWRHTWARAYRGNALTAILNSQYEIARYLTT